MKNFLINLDRSPERLAHMQDVLGRMGLPFERIAAVDGRKLDSATLLKAGGKLSPGEVGCLMSHREAWRRTALGASYAAVLEDDLHISPDMPRFLNSTAWIPPKTDVITLESGRRPVQLGAVRGALAGRSILILASTHSGAGGYILSPHMASSLLRLSEALDSPVDALLFDLPRGGTRASHVYQVAPALCIQDSFLPKASRDARLESTIQADRTRTRRSSVNIIGRIVRELQYPIRKLARATRSVAFGERSATWVQVPYADSVEARNA